MKLAHFNDAPQRYAHANRAFSAAGLAEGTNANTIKTTATCAYTIDGIFYSKGATDNIALAAPDAGPAFYQLPANSVCYLLIALDSSGNVKCIQGKYDGQEYRDPTTGLPQVGDGGIPDCPSDLCPIGLIKVTTGATTFTPGSTDLGAANVTDAYYDLAGVIPVTAP